MTGILVLIGRIFAEAFGQAFAEMVTAWRRDGAQRDLGAAQAQNRLDTEVKEAADAQARINAVDRGGARGVAERLSKRIRG